MDAPQVFKCTFNALINEDNSISIDIGWYQSILEHALSKLGFLNRYRQLYIFESNLNLNIGKQQNTTQDTTIKSS